MARIYHSPSPEQRPACVRETRPKLRERKPADSPAISTGATEASAKEARSASTRQRILRRPEHSAEFLGSFVGLREGERLREVRKSPRKLKTPRKKVIAVFEDGESLFDDGKNGGPGEEVDDTYVVSDAGDSGEEEGEAEAVSLEAEDGEEDWPFEKSGETPLQKLLRASSKESPLELGATQTLPKSSTVLKWRSPFLGPRIQSPSRPEGAQCTSRPASSHSISDDDAAILRFTPPKRISPSKDRPQTPPAQPPSPSKKPGSPSKSHLATIPPAPVRESLDAFWSQDVINDWNEQYSPRKMLTSPRKKRFVTPPDSDAENSAPSPSASPQRIRSPEKTPGRSRVAREMRRAWDVRKMELAEQFLAELDDKICGGRLAELAKGTGGVKVVWSRKLNSTAGRAHWRRETSKVVRQDGSVESIQKHFASIELADKVIDDEVRLVNVVAHEFCHLCNFMISEVKNNPHGKEFKEWARICSAKFADRGIEVTTKHSYAIDYKYVWECRECGQEYKRHSKSIDVAKSGCGKPACKGRLVQTKPVPRAVTTKADGTEKTSEYQTWLRENRGRIQRENSGLGMGGVMEVVGREYRAWKAARDVSERAKEVIREEANEMKLETKDVSTSDLDVLVNGLKVVVLDD